MALEPITRAEQIISGKDLEPITRMERFLKDYGVSNYFGETTVTVKSDTLTWDGNTEGLEYVDLDGMPFYHVSDAVPTIGDCANGFIVEDANGNTYTDEPGLAGGLIMTELVVIAPDDNLTFGDITIPKAGVWFVSAYNIRTVSLTIPNYGKFVSKQTTVKPLDEKYMPILTSPGGKKFKISVDDSGVLTAAEV